jgi:hypothetical protein
MLDEKADGSFNQARRKRHELKAVAEILTKAC